MNILAAALTFFFESHRAGQVRVQGHGHDIIVQYSSILLGLAVCHGLITTSLSEEEKELAE